MRGFFFGQSQGRLGLAGKKSAGGEAGAVKGSVLGHRAKEEAVDVVHTQSLRVCEGDKRVDQARAADQYRRLGVDQGAGLRVFRLET
jgi:hypothetical protein